MPRWGQPTPLPTQVPRGPLVLLCDEATSSDGEILVHRWQKMGMGPVVGTRTWGGVMCSDCSDELIDGGSIGA